ncbi:MAG TPA: alpha/beta fold hydrolase [Steroidobacteraceae bacterium]|nr:alpha/beta fold hydrolase [Steroidobacteraceae bacterium]
MAKANVPHRQVETEPRVRRGYFECRYGQFHVHNAIPPGGGFEEGTALLCVHSAMASGRFFQGLLPLAGRDRSVYAPDLPGFGESDSPPARVGIPDYAAALGDFLDTMRFRQIDLLGHQTGSLIAAELALARPQQVRRLVLASVPVLNDAERDGIRRHPGLAATEDGAHLATEWRRTLESYGPAVPLEVRARAFAEKLRSGMQGAWMLAAAQQYESRQRLSRIVQPALVLRLKDEYWDATPRVRELLPKARFAEVPASNAAVLETEPETILELVRDFLKG